MDRTLVVYAFVWPPDKDFKHNVDANRNSPAYYFEAMRDSMARLVQLPGVAVHFRVHMHPACAALQPRLDASAQTMGVRVEVAYCGAADHWRFPVLARAATLLSHPNNETVVMVDGHDEPTEQVDLIHQLTTRMASSSPDKCAAFTFWPTDGQPVLNPGQDPVASRFKVFSTDTPATATRPWFVDSGMAITTGRFRSALKLDYEAFLRAALDKYGNVWPHFEAGSDEGLLDAALFRSGPERAELVKESSVIAPHWLWPRVPFDLTSVPNAARPVYSSASKDDNANIGKPRLEIMGQDRTMDSARIKVAHLSWGAAQAVTVLAPRKKQKLPPPPH